MERQYAEAVKYLDHVGGGYTSSNLKKYIERNIQAKQKLNELLGLSAEKDYTISLPVTMTNDEVKLTYQYLSNLLIAALEGYTDIDFVKGTVVTPKGQTTKLTRAVAKVKDTILSFDGLLTGAFRELEITDGNFDSIGPRLGEIANNQNQELFITSSIAEFMKVNHNSSYTSCYRHGKLTSTSYWSGTLSYGLDDFTLLVGIRNKHTGFKTGRSWLWLFADGIDGRGVDHGTPFIVQPKSYGEFSTLHRKAVRAYIQKCISPTETWKAGGSGSIEYHSSYGYIDNYDLTFSYLKGEERPKGVMIDFYSDLWCLSCGDDDVNDETGQCICCEETGVKCYCCGDSIDEDDCRYDPNGNPICYYCYDDRYFYCEHCGEDCDIDDREEVAGGRYGTTYMCSHCANNNSDIFYCEECEKYYFTARIAGYESINGNMICEGCADYICDECGVAAASNDSFINTETGETYCEDCAKDLTFTCKECGGIFHNAYVSCEANVCDSCYVEPEESEEEAEQEAA